MEGQLVGLRIIGQKMAGGGWLLAGEHCTRVLGLASSLRFAVGVLNDPGQVLSP